MLFILKIVLFLYRKYIEKQRIPEDKIPFGAIDNPSPFEKIAPSPVIQVNMPEEFCLYEKAKALGWKPQKQSLNSCTGYSRITIAEIQNTIWNGTAISLDGEKQWEEQEKTGGNRSWGDTIQNAWNIFNKFCQGFPETEHRRINDVSVDVLKRWLLLGRPISTGMKWRWLSANRMMNYKLMQQTGYYQPGTGKHYSGHADHIVGWSDSRGAFKIQESELEKWGKGEDKGICWVKYENIKGLMSMRISFDEIDKEYLVKGKEFAVLRLNGKVATV